MKVKVNKNRQVFPVGLSVGISNENNYEVLEFTFPEELENYVKYIEIEAENEEGKLEYVDRIENNKFTLTNRLTKYRELNMEVSCRDLDRTVFKSEIFTVTTGEALNILEDLVEQQEDLFERVERELQEVYQGMEEFKTEIVEDANSRFNTNVTEKTQGFNANAETKTTDFNNNYDTKLNSFNSNYDEKLGTFNTNATSKLEQYNNNDTEKTGAYNTNATEKLSTYNTNATNKVAEYNTNAETKLNAYNTNATQKLAEYDSRVADLHEDLDETQAKVEQYNTNIDTKYTQYNTNAEQKMSAYNSNATTKTSEYNTNAQTKLETYNTNAQSKKEDFDSNAEEKLQEYNDNASALMQSVETLEQKHNTEVAELNEKITDLQTDLNMATDLIPTDTATGSDITVNDSARYYFKKFEIEGKSEQETFTGKNIVKSLYYRGASTLNFYINEKKVVSSMIISGITNVSVNNMTIYLKFGSVTYTLATFNMVANQKFSVSITLTEEQINAIKEAENVYIQLYRPSASSADLSTCTYDEMMLRNSSTTDSYEPYTGGQPAPNPDYEVPIQNITGNVEVKVENANITSGDKLYQTMSTFDSTKCSETTIDNKEVIKFMSNAYRWQMGFNALNYKFKENTQYTIRGLFKRSSNGILYMQIKYKDGSVQNIYSNADGWNELRIVSAADKTIDIIDFSYSTATYWYLDKLSWFVGEGDTTDYIEHEEQTVTFPLSEGQVLHEGDTIEDKIVQRRKTLKLNINQFTTTSFEDGTLVLTNIRNSIGYYKNISGLCSHFQNANNDNIIDNGTARNLLQDNQYNFRAGSTTNERDRIYFKNSAFTTVEDWKNFFNNNEVTLEYELETPIETEFTEAQRTAKAQIDKLYSYKGTTHITSNANLDVTYRKDPETEKTKEHEYLQSQIDELKASVLSLGANT